MNVITYNLNIHCCYNCCWAAVRYRYENKYTIEANRIRIRSCTCNYFVIIILIVFIIILYCIL